MIRLIRSLTACAAVALALPAWPAEWAIEPSVEARVTTTDNINLTPGVHEAMTGIAVRPRATFANRTEATEVTGTASFGFNRYPQDSTLNTDDVSLAVASKFTSERSSYGLSAAFTRDSTLESELQSTGIVQARRQRNLLHVSPTWNYALTERSSVFAEYQYDAAHYEAGSDLTDYSNQQAVGGYQYRLSPSTTASVSGSYSRYETETGSFLTNSYAVNVGLTYEATDRLKLSFGIGGRYSDTKVVRTDEFCIFGARINCEFLGVPLVQLTSTANTSDHGLAFNASADYAWERTTGNLSVSRDLNPTGSGPLVQTDRLSAGIDHKFSERLSGNATASYLISRYIGGLGSDTSYYRLDTALGWKLDEWWSATGGYSYAYQKVTGAPQAATANTVFVAIVYTWPKISISH